MLFLAAWRLGRSLLGSWLRFPEVLVQASAETAVGLAGLSYLVFLAILLPFPLHSLLLAVTVLIAGLVGWALWSLRGLPGNLSKKSLQDLRLLFPPLAFLLVCALPMSLLPATAIDELVYHLEVPKQLLAWQGVFAFRDNIYAYFPGLGESLFLWAMGLCGEAAARLIHTGFGFLLLTAVFGFVRGHSSRRIAALVTWLLASVPSLIVNATLAYVDLIFTLYFLLAVLALLQLLEKQSAKWGIAVGLMAGLGWTTKYTGLQLTLLLVLVLLVEHLLSRRKTIPWAALASPLISLAVVLPYLLRNWWLTGWPLFPFQLPFFQLLPRMNWDPERSQLFLRWLSGFGSGNQGFWEGRLLAPILVFFKARFNEMSAFDGIIGPALLLGPFLLLGSRINQQVRALIWMALFFTYYWAFTTQQVRFLLPALPLLALLTAQGLQRRKWFAVELVLVVLISLNAILGVRQLLSNDPQSFWLGRQTAEEFQMSRVLGAPLYREANRRVSDDEVLYLVNMRNFGYLLDCPWRGDYVFEHFRLGQVLEEGSIGAIDRFFSSQGVTHLMIDEGITLSNLALGSDQQDLLRSFLEERATLLARNSALPGQALYRLHLVTAGPGG